MQSQVSIILPVYNVEPYLRQCLDSVVNQTLRDIQIICVNDGSTDGSPAILEEYAARDPRIEIIHQENQGGGSARNAAYSHIRGKYTYFVDPDDWIDLDLCQQCRDKAEATKADFVVLRYIEHYPEPKCLRIFDHTLPEIRQSPEDKHEIFGWTGTCQRFWHSDFLLSNNIKFSEGKRPCNDVLPSWKGTALANRIAVLNEPLYHYRVRQGSYQQIICKKHFIIMETFGEVDKMLHETGFYKTYKEFFIKTKLEHYYAYSWRFDSSLRSGFLQHMQLHMTKDDLEYCRNTLSLHHDRTLRDFYISHGYCGQLEMMKYYFRLCKYLFFELVKWPERMLRHNIIKPLKKLLGVKKQSRIEKNETL